MLLSPTSRAAAGHGGGYVVYGVLFQDENSRDVARRVINISFLMATFAMVAAILQLITNFYFGTGIFVGAILPLCGYLGVRWKNRPLVGCFSFCNALTATFFAVSLLVTSITLGDFVTCLCNVDCRSQHGMNDFDWQDICREPAHYRTLYWLSVGFGIVMMFLQCTAASLGGQLLRTKYFIAESNIPVAEPVWGTGAGGYYPQPPGNHRYTRAPRDTSYTYASGPIGTGYGTAPVASAPPAGLA